MKTSSIEDSVAIRGWGSFEPQNLGNVDDGKYFGNILKSLLKKYFGNILKILFWKSTFQGSAGLWCARRRQRCGRRRTPGGGQDQIRGRKFEDDDDEDDDGHDCDDDDA